MPIFDRIKQLRLPVDEYLVVGGGAMECYGIRKAGDIDLVVTKRLAQMLLAQGWSLVETSEDKLACRWCEFEAATGYCYGNYSPSVEYLLGCANKIEGVPIIRLEELVKHKREMGREKDLVDIMLIDEYLRSQS